MLINIKFIIFEVPHFILLFKFFIDISIIIFLYF